MHLPLGRGVQIEQRRARPHLVRQQAADRFSATRCVRYPVPPLIRLADDTLQRGGRKLRERRILEPLGGMHERGGHAGGALCVDRPIDRRGAQPPALLRGGGVVAFIGKLTGVESAGIRIHQRLPDVTDDVDRPVAAARVSQHGPAVEQQLQQVGVDRQHLLDARRRPVAPRTVAERPALHVVEKAAADDRVERPRHHLHQRVVSRRDAPQTEPHRRRVHVLGRDAKPPVQRVEMFQQVVLQPVRNVADRH